MTTSQVLFRKVVQVASLPMCLELPGPLFTVDDGPAGAFADHRLQPIVRRQLDHAEDVELQLGSRTGDVGQGRTQSTLAHLFVVFCVVIDVTDWVGHPIAQNVDGETPLALGDPNPTIERPARFGVSDEPFPMLRDAPVANPPGVIAMSHSVPLDPAARNFECSAYPSGLLDPVHCKPRRQPIWIAVIAERIMNAIEPELESHIVAVVDQHAGLAQLRLRERQPVEREIVEIGVVGYPPLVEVQRQRARIRPPDADVIAGLSATGQIEVDLHAEFFFRHDQLPEQAVTRSLPGNWPVPEVVSGAE